MASFERFPQPIAFGSCLIEQARTLDYFLPIFGDPVVLVADLSMSDFERRHVVPSLFTTWG